MKPAIFYCLFLFFICDATDVFAQKSRRRRSAIRVYKRYEGSAIQRFAPFYFFSGNVNALNYFGDLAPLTKTGSTDISFTRPGFGASLGYQFQPSLALRSGLNWGRIKGDDFSSDPLDEDSSPRYARNLSFRNDIKEFHLGLECSVLSTLGGITPSRLDFNAYLFFGVAVFHHNPKGKVPKYDYQALDTVNVLPEAGKWVGLRALGTEGQFFEGSSIKPYGYFQLSIPVSIGARLSLQGPFDAGIEFGYRFLFTDYIDDVSESYASLERFDDPLARIMSDRSAEPITVWNNQTRVTGNIVNKTANGQTYLVNGDLGSGYDGSVRGNHFQRDMIFMTTIKVTYLFWGMDIRRGKGR